jgi:molybdate transport system substrate-binding protein
MFMCPGGKLWSALYRFAAAATVLTLLSLHTVVYAQNVSVFAAVSLNEALDEALVLFERPANIRVVPSYAASSALARQIQSGAPADVFISADTEWMDYLAERKLIDVATRSNLMTNRMVLIAPAASSVQTEIRPGFGLSQMLGDGRLSVADPDSVPAGKYAKAALMTLGVWNSVERRLVRGENVRAALNFVARGEAPLGIVYRTDAYAEKKVRIVATFAPDTHRPIVYPAAMVAGSRAPAARQLLDFLRSQRARAVFEKHGFIAVR